MIPKFLDIQIRANSRFQDHEGQVLPGTVSQSFLIFENETMMVLNVRTDRSEQKVQIKIRVLTVLLLFKASVFGREILL